MMEKAVNIYCDGYDVYTDSEDVFSHPDLRDVLRRHYEYRFDDDFVADHVIEAWSGRDFDMIVHMYYDDDLNLMDDLISIDQDASAPIAIVYRALTDRGMIQA